MDDAELVRAVRAGDREAFGSLVERHRSSIYALCYRMTGNLPDAEDLAHEAFVEAYLKLDQLRDPTKFRAWLRQVALNLCRMWFRRTRPRADDGLKSASEAEPPSEPEDRDLARMSFGLSRLSPAHRVALVLHYLEGLSYEDVAKFLDVPIGTVMSRLHRARRELRSEIEEIDSEGDVPMVRDEEFGREVQAEIALLVDRLGAEREAADRLTVILRRSPERVTRLIEDAEDDASISDLAVLLPRLGPAAMQIALELCLGPAAGAAARAGALLRGVVARCRCDHRGGFRDMPAREAYVIVDRLFDAEAGDAAKAELLLELLGAAEAEPVSVLLTNALLCYTDAAFPLLLERFASASSPDELYASSYVLYGLCRTGQRLCDAILEPLGADDPPRQLVALSAAEALARCLDRNIPPDAVEQRAEEVRVRQKFPPLRAETVGTERVERLAESVAALVDHGQAELRALAIRVLGLLRAEGHAERVRAQLRHPDAGTRRAAILSLAELADVSAADALIHAARAGEPAERCAALGALARLRIHEAEPLLVDLTEDPDPRVQEASVVALGEIAGPDAQKTLHRLLSSGNRRQRNAAAKALFRTRRRPEPSPTRRKREEKIRGAARPFTHQSVGAAIRFALTELRPYEERELTRRIARVCSDYASTRRFLIEQGLMRREAGTYTFTELGAAVWRVEHFIRQHYLA